MKVYQNNNFSNSLTEAILYTNASVIDTALGREESQQRNVELAFDRAMKTGSKQLQFKTMVNLADNLLNQGETEDALDIMIRCLSLAREESNPLFTAYCQESLAEVYLAKTQLELAILSAKEAVGIYTDHNNV
ncbi:tetratricopeptide repeat protein, partial [Vibrio sp. V17_P4S1T151]